MRNVLATSLFLAAAFTGSASAAVVGVADLLNQNGNSFEVIRPLGVTITGDRAVYMVGTMNFDVLAPVSSFTEANLGPGPASRSYNTGFGNAFGVSTIVIAENGTEASTASSFVQGVPVKLVIKYDQITGSTRLWVNPNLLTFESFNTPAATTTVTAVIGSSFNQIVFRGGDFDATDNVVDYTGFAVYFGGSTPFAVPEPATATLGLLSAAGLMMRRRRMA